MKKYLLTLFVFYILCMGNLSGEERRVALSKRIFRNGLVCVIDEKQPYTGVLEEYDQSNKTLKATMSYKDGLLNGERILYYENGLIKSKETYVDGKKNGLTYCYYINGQVMLKSDYLDGRKNGDFFFYNKNGEVKNKITYVNGKKIHKTQL